MHGLLMLAFAVEDTGCLFLGALLLVCLVLVRYDTSVLVEMALWVLLACLLLGCDGGKRLCDALGL